MNVPAEKGLNIYFRNTIRMSFEQFGSRSGPTFDGPDLDPNCLQGADDKIWI